MVNAVSLDRALTNAEIARQLGAVAQQMQAKRENQFKVRAYRRAAETVAGLSEGIAALVQAGKDITRFPNIGKGIAATIGEMVREGSSGQLESLMAEASPEIAALAEYPRLDPKRVLRAYKKFKISSVAELKAKLASGAIAKELGVREEQHFRQAMNVMNAIYLDDAYALADRITAYLMKEGGALKAEATGAFRRKMETISELSFVVEADSFETVVKKMTNYGGGTELVESDGSRARFKLPVGLPLTLHRSEASKWGVSLLVTTGSEKHLEKLQERAGPLDKWVASPAERRDETRAFRTLNLDWIPPELREGNDELELAARGKLPRLITLADIKGELHAHSTGSDGSHTIEQMAAKAVELGYDFIGITDHSQSLKIARGMTAEALWKQIRAIDKLNAKGLGVRILKSSEVDILADGSLDYPDELLAELDYSVCSIHSRFALGKKEQTERIMRAMDNPHFSILGHTTGRLLLKRPGYEVDWPRLIGHAAAAKVSFEINASPDRLDISAEAAREVKAAGIRIAINTDAHHTRDFSYLYCGIDVARRAGLEAKDVLNCYPWAKLARLIKR